MENPMMKLLEKALYFGVRELCEGYLDMPSGCDGCPLFDETNVDEDGNNNCYEALYVRFLNECRDDLKKFGLLS
ncbi:MAG: hypothetical protein ACI3XQ_01295 [Eubacteriales bacterium]